MSAETVLVPRAEFDMEEPWRTPGVCTPVRLRSSLDGAAPRLPTSAALFYDDDYLSVLFSAADDALCATWLEHDAPLYEEDVFELFVAPETLTEYFEIEVNPLGTLFDARVVSPDGDRQTMRVDRAWTCEGLFAAVRIQRESSGMMSVDTIVRIPFFALERSVPGDGETWRANLFRIDRSPSGNEFSAWQPTHRRPADFHVPAAFGVLRFGS